MEWQVLQSTRSRFSEGEVNARGNNIQRNKVLPVSSLYAREVPHRAREVTG